MAFLDTKLILGEAQAVTGAVGTTDSTNTIDLGPASDADGSAATNEYGDAGRLWFNAKVDTLFTGASSAATVKVALYSGPTVGGMSAVSGAASAAVAVGSLIAGYSLLRMPLPVTLNRWVKAVFTKAGATVTAGKITTWIGMDHETHPR